MTVAELQELEEVKLLVTKGQTTGVLTYSEVATALAEVDLDETDVEDLHSFLEKAEIELVEEVDPAAKANEVERATDAKGRRKKATLDLRPDMTTDSLQLFLKDIGKVRLLTAQEEVDLAKRIERGDLDAKQKMVESNRRLVVSIAAIETTSRRLDSTIFCLASRSPRSIRRARSTSSCAVSRRTLPMSLRNSWRLSVVMSGLRSSVAFLRRPRLSGARSTCAASSAGSTSSTSSISDFSRYPCSSSTSAS